MCAFHKTSLMAQTIHWSGNRRAVMCLEIIKVQPSAEVQHIMMPRLIAIDYLIYFAVFKFFTVSQFANIGTMMEIYPSANA